MTTSKSLSRLQEDNISHWTTSATEFLILLYICQLLSNLVVLYLLSDSQILTLYHEDDSVPNKAATTLIGEVKGHFNGLLLVSSNVVIKTKRTALGLDDNDLCNTEPWILYLASVTTNTSTVNWKKRKRTETHDEASSTLRSARQRTFEQPQRLPAFIEEFPWPGTSLLAANSTIMYSGRLWYSPFCCSREEGRALQWRGSFFFLFELQSTKHCPCFLCFLSYAICLRPVPEGGSPGANIQRIMYISELSSFCLAQAFGEPDLFLG